MNRTWRAAGLPARQKIWRTRTSHLLAGVLPLRFGVTASFVSSAAFGPGGSPVESFVGAGVVVGRSRRRELSA